MPRSATTAGPAPEHATGCPSSTENWILRRARLTPHHIALIDDAGTLTFSELERAARRCARAALPLLDDLRGPCGGMGAPGCGQRVAILSSNCRSYVLWLVGAHMAGIQSVPLNARLSVPELARQLDDCRPFLLLCDDAHHDVAQAAVARAAAGGAERAGRQPAFEPPRVARFDEAAGLPLLPEEEARHRLLAEYDFGRVCNIIYTSGSTGCPKGVLQTFGNHWHSAVNCCLNLGFNAESDIWGCATPLFHMSGLSIVMRSLVCGVSMRLYDRFDARAVNDDALRGRITCLSAVTYQLERMLDDLDGRSGAAAYPPSLRFVLQGGGPLPPATLKRCENAGMRAVQSFGMTETASQVVSLGALDAPRKPGSAGRPLASVQLRIAAQDAASDEALPAGSLGRILIKSPTVAVGYLGQDERYRASFTEHGWFDTGDLGHLDDEGYLYVACRRRDLIISGGENVYPAEVEQAIARHPSVDRVAVVGVDDPVWGSVPVAMCTPAKAGQEARLPNGKELGLFCRDLLAPYKCPRRVVWVDELPTTASGKVRRDEVDRIVRAELARD